MSDFVYVLNATGLMPYIVATIVALSAIALFSKFVKHG
jgi:hypothetical protein